MTDVKRRDFLKLALWAAPFVGFLAWFHRPRTKPPFMTQPGPGSTYLGMDVASGPDRTALVWMDGRDPYPYAMSKAMAVDLDRSMRAAFPPVVIRRDGTIEPLELA
jgi:hypothetical protein